MTIMLHVSLSNHWPPPVLQVTGQKVQRGIWTTLRPPPTTTAAALLPAPGRASAWKHASAFWTCAARVPTTPKTQTVVPRRRRPGRLWSWSNESTEQKADLMEGFWLRLDSSWPKLSDKLFWAVYTYLPQLHSMVKRETLNVIVGVCVLYILAVLLLPFPLWRTRHLRTLMRSRIKSTVGVKMWWKKKMVRNGS